MLADDGHGLCRGDVEARTPVGFVGNAIEIFFDNLLPPRQSIAAAHEEIIANRAFGIGGL